MNAANPPIDPYAGINALYQEIENDPDVLEKIDKIPFVETPLHRAASDEDIRLATEIIRLKPSFAWKLNPQGLSPIHLAVHNGRIGIVRRFVSINKDLVRVKGKKGLTPLYLAAENGQIDVLAEFLIASPDSIEDLTVEGETALHIAGNNRQFETLAVLIDWLRLSSYPLRKSILNQKNESGETILHVSTRNRNPQTVKLLIENGIKLDAKNSMGSTAMDIAEMRDFENAEIKNMLVNAKAKHGIDVTDAPAPTPAQRLTSKLTIAEIVDDFRRKRSSLKIDDTTRNAFMAVAVLIATMIYQSALSPPGGVYQSDASAASTNRTSSNSTFLVGKSVMSTDILLTSKFKKQLNLNAQFKKLSLRG